ncbi:RNA-directed DNA polymerase, eukaryota, reverse transcriptase zinc-binding domain protein, partial [Tanacetum coccineum]
FHRGLKHGDPISPFLFILIMKSLHISVQRVVDADMFRRISMGPSLQLSHLFYVDDAVFMGHWSDSNIDIIVQVLECFYRASGLCININKSKLMRISVANVHVDQAAAKIGCVTLKAHFSYLGSKVCGLMRQINDSKVGLRFNAHLSYVIIQSPHEGSSKNGIYSLSFFNGVDHNGMKPIWVKWSKVLASKEKGDLGVSSFYGLNIALLFKWVWRFRTQISSLWARVIKGIRGEDGKLGKNVKHSHPSIWLDCSRDEAAQESRGDVAFKSLYPRVYALESCKNDTVAFLEILASMEGVALVDMRDRLVWSLEGSGEFSVASIMLCPLKSMFMLRK